MLDGKALFLDRDGVINRDDGYVSTSEKFHFIDGIFDLCRHAQSKNYLIIIVTNQSGIARGFYSVDDFHKLNNWMLAQFKMRTINITHVYYCPHHPQGCVLEFTRTCNCRKPKPGLFTNAAADYPINLSQSIAVGDKERDLEAAYTAGVGTGILLTTDQACTIPKHIAHHHAASPTDIIKLI